MKSHIGSRVRNPKACYIEVAKRVRCEKSVKNFDKRKCGEFAISSVIYYYIQS